ncbi:MAG: TRAP transporter small permease subunit [Parvularculaceae bacterium]|nr:TRAP transporter small permease subunit [Parvularculaceae bacterium]
MLNWLAAGALFPLMMLPLASLARRKSASGALQLALVATIIAGALLFARAAVEIDPPRLSAGMIAAMAIGAIGAAALAGAKGADRLSAALAAPMGKLVTATGRLALYLVFAMAAVQFAIVILRYVFGLNYIAMQESVTYMHGAVFLLAGGYALLTDDHVRVDIIYREARPRFKALVDLAGTYLLLFPFCLVSLWAAGPYIANAWAVREGSMEQSGIEGVYLLKSLIAIYLTLLALAGFVIATRAAETLKTRSD